MRRTLGHRLFSFFLFALVFIPQLLNAETVHRGSGKRTLLTLLTSPKYLTMVILALVALVLLKKRLLQGGVKATLLLISVFFFGVAGNLALPFFSQYAMHPSPICAVAKAMLYGFATPMIATALVILLLSLIGPKLFCGWVCPVGALQELMFMLRQKLKWPQLRLPFRLTNRIRSGLFLVFLFFSGTAIIHLIMEDGSQVAVSLYDYFNAFHGYEWGGDLVAYIPLLLSALTGLFVYRPYCHIVCPVGLLTHWLEPLAWLRINVNPCGCNDCQSCIPKTPCQATPEIIKGSLVRPDCFACGDCLSRCHNSSFDLTGR